MSRRLVVGILMMGLSAVGYRPLAAQSEVAMATQKPRFVAAWAPRGQMIDASNAPVLQRRVSLDVTGAPFASVLGELARQARVDMSYNPARLPADRTVSLHVREITMLAALTEVLVNTGLDVLVQRGGQLTLVASTVVGGVAQNGAVVGRVADSKTGQGLGGVDVSLDGARSRTVTDADGHYRLAEIAPGSYTVLARRIGYAPERRAVTVTAGRETPVDVALHPAATRLGDVVVTAQKREERLQDVPMSIAVVSLEEIDRRGLVSAEDYLRGLPGVNQTESSVGTSVVIRGLELNNSYQNAAQGGASASFFGETPTTSSAGLIGGASVDIKLVDIERVEVLRGPQGTAFGSSSLSGAVRTIPVAPQLDRFSGKLAASYSATTGTGGDNYNFQAVGNLPLIKDKLALRATAYRYDESGFYRGVAGSDPAVQAAAATYGAQAFATNEDDIGASSFTGGRIAVLFRPSENLDLTVTYLTQKTEVDGWVGANREGYHQALLAVPQELAGRRWNRGGGNETHIDLANAVAAYNFGWGNLLATYSYLESGSQWSYPWSLFSPFPVAVPSVGDHQQHTGEIRLSTQFGGPWNFLAGLYAEKLEDSSHQGVYWHGDPATSVFRSKTQLVNDFSDRRDLTQKAAFGEVSWRFLSRFALTGGVRVYDYDRTNRFDTRGDFGDDSQVRPVKASGTSFRGNLRYQPNDDASSMPVGRRVSAWDRGRVVCRPDSVMSMEMASSMEPTSPSNRRGASTPTR